MPVKKKQNRLFRASLGKFTKGIEAVLPYSKTLNDGSWVWLNKPSESTLDQKEIEVTVVSGAEVLPEESFPIGLKLAPNKVKGSGEAYAYWSLLLSAVVFQNKDVDSFIKRIAAWWGDSEFPTNPYPESEIGWEALFGEKDEWFDARVDIFKEICSSKELRLIAHSWTLKIKDSRVFNLFDAGNLARTFPKSFADPFLYKAQRAIWLFTWPYKNISKLKVKTELTPPALPGLLTAPKLGSGIEFHPILLEKLKKGGFVRDESAEKSSRAFVVLNGPILLPPAELESGYNFSNSVIFHETTDY